MLLAMQLSFAWVKFLGMHGDWSLDTTKDGGVIDIVTDIIGVSLELGHMELVRELRSISESLRVQVTFGVG